MVSLMSHTKVVGEDSFANAPLAANANDFASRHHGKGLLDLPLEVLYIIFAYSGSKFLLATSRYLYNSLHQAPAIIRFQFLDRAWTNFQISRLRPDHILCRTRSCFDKQQIRLGHLLHETGSNIFKIEAGAHLPDTECQQAASKFGMNVYSFVSSFAVCTSGALQLFDKYVEKAIPFTSVPLLPKRLFRSLQKPKAKLPATQVKEGQEHQYGTPALNSLNILSGEEPCYFPDRLAFLEQFALKEAQGLKMVDRIGPIPPPEQLEVLISLLDQHHANPSSHNGFPLAMAVHNRAYILIHLLLFFGGDANCKDGLAIKIAIQNGDLDALRLLTCRPSSNKLSAIAGNFKGKNLPRYIFDLSFTQAHLQLAIKHKQWAIVDFLWHKHHVVPDMACLRLIEKYR